MIDFRHPRFWGQVLFWSILWFLFPLLFTHDLRLGWDYMLPHNLITAIATGLLVAINLQFLLPLYYRKQNVLFLISGVLVIMVLLWIVQYPDLFWDPITNGGRPRMPGRASIRLARQRWMGSMMPLIASFLGSSLYEIAIYAQQKDKETIRLQKEKLETEIKFLKSQINPHFLFNALNNIYTLSLLQSEQAPENILRLSEMLRYVLYDCNEALVPLRKEVQYIRHYVHLFQLKDSTGLKIALDLDESQPDLSLAPMLLIPFVENAFKHSKIEDTEKGWIKIKLITSSRQLQFEVLNSKPPANYLKDATGGIGIENVRRRLELLYPGQYKLDIMQTEETYSVNLLLSLL
ncbi:MAG: histidine kinase [Lewinellaceae bacterium]|nr:histidine kinase [Lewinellaceae bacterium]